MHPSNDFRAATNRVCRVLPVVALTLVVCAPLAAAQSHTDHSAHSFTPVAATAASRVAVRLVPIGPYRALADSGDGAVRVQTGGAEVTVVRVPVPSAVRLDAVMSLRRAAFRIVPGRHVQVLGATKGEVDPARDSTLVVALRVSRRAPAGRTLGGTVEFSVGTVAAAVPIELEIPPRRQLSLSLESRTLLATRGRWNTVPLRVQNAGNIEELAAVGVGVPDGWRADVRSASRLQRVSAGQTLSMTLRVWIPPQANSGLVLLPVRLVRPGERDTTENVQVDVIGALASEQVGARVTASVISGLTTDQQSTTAYALGVAGNLSDSLTITGRFSYAGALDASGARGMLLARSGMLTGPPVLDLRHPQLQLQAGSALVPLPELSGQNLAGIGAAATIHRDRWSVQGYDLRPLGASLYTTMLPMGDGRYQGGELAYTRSAVRTSAFGARLVDSFTRRDLTAYGMRLRLGEPGGAQFLSEVAYRDVSGRRGLGVSTTFQRTGTRSFVEARVLHAPGGSAGFARAIDDISLSASRSLGARGFVALNGWRQRDANPMLGALRNSGWSFSPAVDAKRLGTFGVDVRGSEFRSTLDGTRIGNRELSGGGMWTHTMLGTSIITRSALSRIDRDLQDTAWRSQSQQWRLDHSVSLLRGTSYGSVQANWTYQQFSALTGNLPAQQSVHVRAERIRPRLASPLSFEAEVQRMQVGATGPVYWSARTGATLDLRLGLSVTFAAERNPFMNMVTGGHGTPMAYTLRVDRTTMVPRLLSGARNTVFRDDNGNGRRDRGEGGVGGVVIRCGPRLVQTDHGGRFSCAEREQVIDPRTVPVGLLAQTVGVTAGKPVALRVVQPLRVALTLTGSDTLRLRREMLSDAVVFARDSSGAVWYARSDSVGYFVLEALPSGRYTIGVDAAGLEEPLTVNGSEPIVQIGGTERPALVTIGLRARPVRVKTFDAASPGVPLQLAPPPEPVRPLRKAPRAVLDQRSNGVAQRPS